jgi:sulfatase modifying factor 1
MKKLTKTILLFFLVVLFHNSFSQENDKKSILEEKLPRKAKEYMKEMAFIPMGVFNTGNYYDLYYQGEDTSLIYNFFSSSKTVTLQAFYMSKMEISNKQYKEFVQWTLERKAMDILAKHDKSLSDENGRYKEDIPIDWSHKILKEYLYKNDSVINADSITYSFKVIDFYGAGDYEIRNNYVSIYPDTTVWQSKLGFYNPYVDLYFSHPAYENFPVAGVSYMQAEAYCHWLTNQFYQDYFLTKKVLEKKSHYFDVYKFLSLEAGKPYKNFEFPQFRLPTEMEWQYTALGGKDFIPFPWGSDKVFSKKGKPMANFAPIKDENGILILTHNMTSEFNMRTTSKGGSYPPNGYGLYDMAGNVSEWCSTKYYPETFSFAQDLNIPEYDKEEIKNNHFRVVKGGSWADGLIYQLIAAKTIHYETEQSCKIGFRVVMSY